MKIVRYLLMLAAFLIMVSSAFSLFRPVDRTAVYINVAAMATLAIAITVLNFKTPRKDRM